MPRSRAARSAKRSMCPPSGYGLSPHNTSERRSCPGRIPAIFPPRPPSRIVPGVIVHLIDGTFELFRYFLSPAAAFDRSTLEELRAVRGVIASVVALLEGGATHLGVATDHVIESFRNGLWPSYKTGEGIDPDLLAQFQLLEEVLSTAG